MRRHLEEVERRLINKKKGGEIKINFIPIIKLSESSCFN